MTTGGVPFRVDASDFGRAARALDDAAQKGLTEALNRRLRLAARPMISRTREVARDRVPAAGGLAAAVVRADQDIDVRVTRASAEVRIVLPRRGPSAATDKGRFKHPVFGDRSVWVWQSIKPGWWSGTIKKDGPRIMRPGVEEAVAETLEQIARSGGRRG